MENVNNINNEKSVDLRAENIELKKERDSLKAELGTLKEQLVALKEQKESQDFMITAALHDIKNPMHGIAGFSLLVSETMMKIILKNAKEEEIKESYSYLEAISDSAGGLNKLLEDLSELHKTNNALKSSKIELIDLFSDIEDTLGLLSGLALQKKITLENEISNDLKIKSNNMIFSTCIRNFVANAIKFTKENGTIRVYSEEQNDSIKICVSDNGVGMTKGQIASFFNKIGMHNTTLGTNGEKGTGFGIYFCKKMIESVGGKIEVESEGEGKGSTFTIILPNNKE
jgi:signal transduction histidine kinase